MALSHRPLVSVAIATHNRADLLPEAVSSVLAQTMPDLEVVIVDDGSTDGTADVVRRLQARDGRVRYFRQDNAGISAARNHAADVARGLYTAVHDDDDIMLPWRLQKQLETFEQGAAGAYGCFVNFDDETGDLVFHHGRRFTHGAVLLTGFAPGHSTWLVRTDIIRSLRYDESLTSAVDNNLALRMLRSGIQLTHSGVMCVLRRVHGRSITAADAPNQNRAARMSREMVARGISSYCAQSLQDQAVFDWGIVSGRAVYDRILTPYLPDHLATRNVLRRLDDEPGANGDFSVRHGQEMVRYRLEPEVGLADLLEWHRGGTDLVVRAGTEGTDWLSTLVGHFVDRIVSRLVSDGQQGALLWTTTPVGSPDLEATGPGGQQGVTIRGPMPVRDALLLADRTSAARIRLLGQDLESVLPEAQAALVGEAG